MYADDSTLPVPMPSNLSMDAVHQFTDAINNELSLVNAWLSTNKMLINSDKTKYMVFSYKIQITLPPIKMDDVIIQRTNKTKFLGIIYDDHSTFKLHISYLRTKISKWIGILLKLNRSLPVYILSKLKT